MDTIKEARELAKKSDERIRVSTQYLGWQLFTMFINGTGWDSIGFAFPFWILYLGIRTIENCINGKLISIHKHVIRDTLLLLGWLVMNVISAIVYYKDDGALKLGFYYLVGVLFYVSATNSQFNEREVQWLTHMYITMSVCAAILLVVQRAPVPNYTNRLSIKVFGRVKDPNYFSAYLMFSCLVCLHRYICGNIKKALWPCLIIAGAILLTGSRSSFLSLCIGIVIIVIGSMKNRRAYFKIILLGCIGLVVLFMVLPKDLIFRLVNFESYNDGSNQLRHNIWMAAIGIWLDSFYFGAGQNCVANYGVNYGARIHMMTHSTYFDILAEFGTVGFILFMSIPIGIAYNAFKKRNMLILAGLASTLATAAIISAQYSQYYWFNMVLFYSILRFDDYVVLEKTSK